MSHNRKATTTASVACLEGRVVSNTNRLTIRPPRLEPPFKRPYLVCPTRAIFSTFVRFTIYVQQASGRETVRRVLLVKFPGKAYKAGVVGGMRGHGGTRAEMWYGVG